jgi:hypothetical protein
MFVFNRPLGAVAAGLGVALLIACLDRLSQPPEALHAAPQRTSLSPSHPSNVSFSEVYRAASGPKLPLTAHGEFDSVAVAEGAYSRTPAMIGISRQLGITSGVN